MAQAAKVRHRHAITPGQHLQAVLASTLLEQIADQPVFLAVAQGCGKAFEAEARSQRLLDVPGLKQLGIPDHIKCQRQAGSRGAGHGLVLRDLALVNEHLQPGQGLAADDSKICRQAIEPTVSGNRQQPLPTWRHARLRSPLLPAQRMTANRYVPDPFGQVLVQFK